MREYTYPCGYVPSAARSNVVERWIGATTAPVVGSTSCPAWTARVSNRRLLEIFIHSVPAAAFAMYLSPQRAGVDTSAAQTFNFADIPRGSSGQVGVDVAMQWFRKAGPGPTPGKCDICELLRQKGIITLPFIGRVQLIPASILEECKKRVKIDLDSIGELLDDLLEGIADPCGTAIDQLQCSGFLCDAGKFSLKTLCRAGLARGTTSWRARHTDIGRIVTGRTGLRARAPRRGRYGGDRSQGRTHTLVQVLAGNPGAGCSAATLAGDRRA